MVNSKKNILVFLYLVAVLGFGISSIFIGRSVADRQKEILPEETKAAGTTLPGMECSRHCRWEFAAYCEGGEQCMICQGACKLRKENSCETLLGEYMCSDCWVPACEEATPTPTPKPTATPTPTPTPPPGCWETCTPGTCPQGLDCQDVNGLRCVNPSCPSEEICECPVLACLDLAATSTELVEGDKVDFTCKGNSGVDSPVDHVEFRAQIDGGAWASLGTAPASKTDGEYEGTISYTVPQTGNYQIECRVCTSTDTSVCTEWGQAE
jgi:hypothetical protein